jgi:hypothetical protein
VKETEAIVRRQANALSLMKRDMDGPLPRKELILIDMKLRGVDKPTDYMRELVNDLA